MKSTLKLIASVACAAACALALSACGGGSDDTTVVADPTITPAAFSATDTTVGTGTVAAAGDLVTINYTGWLYNSTATGYKGTQFETSVGGNPISFTLGVGAVIPGWDQGVVGMKVGGSRTLIITPSLAYGNNAVTTTSGVVIPAKSGLVFDVTVVSVKKAGT
jgi:FKBP-type peptidyl-prolyl cis-trans isomerase